MISVKSHKVLNPFVFFQILFLVLAFSSFAQTKQSYRNHEEIEVSGGMKVEILKCTGEGPTEICDCIYFTDKRQNGTRMKQNANQLKEEERAALLAKGVKNPLIRRSTSAGLTDNRADKAIPSSIIPKPKPAYPEPTLEEAVKKADSVAKASSQKMKESLAKVTPADDSTEMDQVFIPKVTETGGTRMETSAPKVNTQNTPRDTVAAIKIAPKDTVANVSSVSKKPVPADSASKPIVVAKATPQVKNNKEIKEPDVTKPTASVDRVTKIVPATKNNPETKNPVVAKTPVSDTVAKPAIKDNSVITSPPANNVSATTADTVENGWVKQYQHVKAVTDTAEQIAVKTLPGETKHQDAATVANEEASKATLKNELKALDSVTNNSPAISIKNSKKKEEKVKEPVEIVKSETKQSSTSASANFSKDTASASNAAVIASPQVSKEKAYDTSSISSTRVAQSVVTHNDPVVSTASATNNNTPIADEGSSLIKTVSTTERNVIGKSAEVNTKGEWEKVTILDKETEFLYKVHYRGKTADHDEWVSVTQIRNIETGANASTNTNTSTINKPASDKPVKGPKVNVNCSFEAPAPPVSNGDKFSEKLAKRKIYEQYVNSKNTVKTGVTFLSLVAESPYVNTVSISATNTLEVKFSFAPAGAMIYPVKTEYKICEQVLGKTSSKAVNSNFGCFRNKEGAWTCSNLE